ncbi:MAG: helix-turn-helix domain-containing protein [Longibaculum sp.]
MKISYAPFWKTLQEKGLSQYVLINKMGVRTSLLHKLRHNLDVRLSTLADLCDILDCQIDDVVVFIEDKEKVKS